MLTSLASCLADYTNPIPQCIADGEYLLRIQSLAIHNPGSTPQWYVSCAQISVTGGGSLAPATVSIPGVFKATDPGYTANVSLLTRSYQVTVIDILGRRSTITSRATPSQAQLL